MTDTARVTEIVPDLYAISIYVPEFNLRFNHFPIKDDEPLIVSNRHETDVPACA